MKELLCDDLWKALAERSRGHVRLRAAIAYVTKAHLEFVRGDVLICDASEASVRAAMTRIDVLRALLEAGVEVRSLQGLHTKMGVIDNLAFIGSANMSERAGVATFEAVLLTDDSQALAVVAAEIERLRRLSSVVDESYLEAAVSWTPVASNRPIRADPPPTVVNSSPSRIWVLWTEDLSERIERTEAAIEQSGRAIAEAQTRMGYSVHSIRLTGRSKFRSAAKPGDVLVEMYQYLDDEGEPQIEVNYPVPIIHKMDSPNGRSTRVYVEYSDDALVLQWEQVVSGLAALGARPLELGKDVELTGRATGLLAIMDAAASEIELQAD